MKRRSIQEELQVLATRFESVLCLLTSKQAAPILKQMEVLQKRVRPKRSGKNSPSKNQNSGLLKPVAISQEIATFAGWDPSEFHSRVDVTKSICEYIKREGLQKQSNKKTILPDDVLKKLLNWNEDMQKMLVTVTNVELSTEAEQIVFVIDTPPVDGLQTLSYYNMSELYTQNNEFVAVLKNIKQIVQEDGLQTAEYTGVVEKRQDKIDISTSFVIKVPLTYPKIQARISTHLAETEKPPKKTRINKSSDSQSKPKKSKKKQILLEEAGRVE